MLGIALAALLGAGYTFGGFDADETQYLKRGPRDLVCAPPAKGCHPVDKKTARGFHKPSRSHRLAVVVADDGRIELRDGDRVLGAFSPGARVLSVNTNVFESPGGGLVAVEYEAAAAAGKASDVVVFDVTRAPAPTPEPRAPAARAPAPAPGEKSAYERALGKGGVWEQRIQACERAGVHLELKKTRRFDLRVTTKCQGHKEITALDGTWTSEGSDTLVLGFKNEDGPIERLACHFATCADVPEDCLTCTQDDVSFTMMVVRR